MKMVRHWTVIYIFICICIFVNQWYYFNVFLCWSLAVMNIENHFFYLKINNTDLFYRTMTCYQPSKEMTCTGLRQMQAKWVQIGGSLSTASLEIQHFTLQLQLAVHKSWGMLGEMRFCQLLHFLMDFVILRLLECLLLATHETGYLAVLS